MAVSTSDKMDFYNLKHLEHIEILFKIAMGLFVDCTPAIRHVHVLWNAVKYVPRRPWGGKESRISTPFFPLHFFFFLTFEKTFESLRHFFDGNGGRVTWKLFVFSVYVGLSSHIFRWMLNRITHSLCLVLLPWIQSRLCVWKYNINGVAMKGRSWFPSII